MLDAARKRRYGLVAVAVAVAAGMGLLAGNWAGDRLDRHASERERLAQVDEYQGLAQRVGITGEVVLDVHPASQTIAPGTPAVLTVRLTNRSRKRIFLNSWVEPYPALLASNQLPLKVDIRLNRERISYHGDAVVRALHEKEDFVALRPGESRTVTIDLAKPAGRGRWDMSTPGVYEVALWYETYLSGKWVGVNAWTGMTNPVVVQVVIAAPGRPGS